MDILGSSGHLCGWQVGDGVAKWGRGLRPLCEDGSLFNFLPAHFLLKYTMGYLNSKSTRVFFVLEYAFFILEKGFVYNFT